MPQARAKTVAHVLSSNYSGSHVLALLLGSHSRAVQIGEAKRVAKVKSHRPCHRCGPFEACPMGRGISPDMAGKYHDILFDRFPDADVLVDISKKHVWAERFLDDPGHERRFIHLVRDPRALVRRWMGFFDTPAKRRHQRWKVMRAFPRKALGLMLAPLHEVYVYKWLMQNRLLSRFLREHALPHLIVPYDALATDPERELRRITPFLGLTFEPGQLEFWRAEHHGDEKFLRMLGDERIVSDQRWQSEVDPGVQRWVTANADCRSYLEDLGLAFTGRGLARAEDLDNAGARSAS